MITDIINNIKYKKSEAKSCDAIEVYEVSFQGVEVGDVLIDEDFGLDWAAAKASALSLVEAAIDAFPKAFKTA